MEELELYRSLALDTLDYLIDHYSNSIIVDGNSPIKDHYEQQKQLVEKYFKEQLLSKLKMQFEKLAEPLRMKGDVKFANYLWEKSNQNVDVFKEVKARVSEIIGNKKINNEQEAKNVAIALNMYNNSQPAPIHEEILKQLLSSYYETHSSSDLETSSTTSQKNKAIHQIEEIVSPDGKKRLSIVRWQSGKNSSTSVSIIFEQASTGIYGKMGLDYDLRADWKNNETILITSKKDNVLEEPKYRQIQSFDDIIFIEYEEI